MSIFLIVAVCVAVVGLLLRRRGHRWLTISAIVCSGSAVLAAAVMLLVGWWLVLRETVQAVPAFHALIPPPAVPHINSTPLPLVPGDRFPEIDAQGWINAPPRPGYFSGNVAVFDIFDDH